MRYKELEEEWTKRNNSFAIRVSRKETLIAKQEDIEKKIEALNIPTLENCFNILNSLSDKQRNEAKGILEDLGTKALKYSYDADYRMEIEIPEKNGNIRRQAYVYVVDEKTGVKTDPLDENGGGIVDLISVAMRIIILVSHDTPRLDGPIILDEPFKMLSIEYIPLAMNFLKKVASDFNRQIIMVTHNRYIAESSESIIVIGDDE